MAKKQGKIRKEIKFIDGKLYLKIAEDVTELGTIITRKGCLTRQQKLQAVAANGNWITI